jgi:hypothetical protein
MLFFLRFFFSLSLFYSFLFCSHAVDSSPSEQTVSSDTESNPKTVISGDKERANCYVKWELSNLSAEPMISGQDWRVEYDVKLLSYYLSNYAPFQSGGSQTEQEPVLHSEPTGRCVLVTSESYVTSVKAVWSDYMTGIYVYAYPVNGSGVSYINRLSGGGIQPKQKMVKGDSLRISSIQPGQTWARKGMTLMGPLPPGKYNIRIESGNNGFSADLKDIEVLSFEEDEPEAGELDDQAIKDILVNYFMAAEEVTRTGNLSHLERYAAKEALKIEGRIAQRKIEYLKQVGTICVNFWFKVHGLQKMFDYDRVGQDTFQVKFYLDRDITYRKKNGKERVSQLRQASHAATLERLTDSQGRKVWKVTEVLFWEGPLTEQDLPAIATEELKKNSETVVYPFWEYDIDNPDSTKNLKEYIDRHWGPTSENYNKEFHFHGSDCTNWVSQILIKGGRPQYILNNTQPQKQLENWYYNEKEAGHKAPDYQKTQESHTFIRSNALYQHLKLYESYCTCSEDDKFGQTLSTGDLIFVDYKPNFIFLKGRKDHTYVVYENDDEILVSSHSNSRHKDSFFVSIKPYVEENYGKNYKIGWRYCKFNNKIKNEIKNMINLIFRAIFGLSRDRLYMADTEVTQAQWEQVMGYNNSYPKHPHYPVNFVNWNEIQEFIKKLEKMEGGKYKYRLPTEKEWLYTARAGATTDYHFGNSSSELKNYAWYRDNSGNSPHIVGQLKPNAFGMFDMHGNVAELLSDVDQFGYKKVINCSYDEGADYCKFSHVTTFNPEGRDFNVGFRLVLSPSSLPPQDELPQPQPPQVPPTEEPPSTPPTAPPTDEPPHQEEPPSVPPVTPPSSPNPPETPTTPPPDAPNPPENIPPQTMPVPELSGIPGSFSSKSFVVQVLNRPASTNDVRFLLRAKVDDKGLSIVNSHSASSFIVSFTKKYTSCHKTSGTNMGYPKTGTVKNISVRFDRLIGSGSNLVITNGPSTDFSYKFGGIETHPGQGWSCQ